MRVARAALVPLVHAHETRCRALAVDGTGGKAVLEVQVARGPDGADHAAHVHTAVGRVDRATLDGAVLDEVGVVGRVGRAVVELAQDGTNTTVLGVLDRAVNAVDVLDEQAARGAAKPANDDGAVGVCRDRAVAEGEVPDGQGTGVGATDKADVLSARGHHVGDGVPVAVDGARHVVDDRGPRQGAVAVGVRGTLEVNVVHEPAVAALAGPHARQAGVEDIGVPRELLGRLNLPAALGAAVGRPVDAVPVARLAHVVHKASDVAPVGGHDPLGIEGDAFILLVPQVRALALGVVVARSARRRVIVAHEHVAAKRRHGHAVRGHGACVAGRDRVGGHARRVHGTRPVGIKGDGRGPREPRGNGKLAQGREARAVRRPRLRGAAVEREGDVERLEILERRGVDTSGATVRCDDLVDARATPLDVVRGKVTVSDLGDIGGVADAVDGRRGALALDGATKVGVGHMDLAVVGQGGRRPHEAGHAARALERGRRAAGGHRQRGVADGAQPADKRRNVIVDGALDGATDHLALVDRVEVVSLDAAHEARGAEGALDIGRVDHDAVKLELAAHKAHEGTGGRARARDRGLKEREVLDAERAARVCYEARVARRDDIHVGNGTGVAVDRPRVVGKGHPGIDGEVNVTRKGEVHGLVARQQAIVGKVGNVRQLVGRPDLPGAHLAVGREHVIGLARDSLGIGGQNIVAIAKLVPAFVGGIVVVGVNGLVCDVIAINNLVIVGLATLDRGVRGQDILTALLLVPALVNGASTLVALLVIILVLGDDVAADVLGAHDSRLRVGGRHIHAVPELVQMCLGWVLLGVAMREEPQLQVGNARVHSLRSTRLAVRTVDGVGLRGRVLRKWAKGGAEQVTCGLGGRVLVAVVHAAGDLGPGGAGVHVLGRSERAQDREALVCWLGTVIDGPGSLEALAVEVKDALRALERRLRNTGGAIGRERRARKRRGVVVGVGDREAVLARHGIAGRALERAGKVAVRHRARGGVVGLRVGLAIDAAHTARVLNGGADAAVGDGELGCVARGGGIAHAHDATRVIAGA